MTHANALNKRADLGLAALLAITGLIPCAGAVFTGGAWEGQATVGLLLVTVAAVIATDVWRTRRAMRCKGKD